MRLYRILAVLAFAALVTSTPAFADLILSGTAGAGFIPFPAGPYAVGNTLGFADANQGGGTPYWNHPSFDALTPTAGCNTGWVMSGGSMANCVNVKGPAFLSDDSTPNAFWGITANGNYDPSFTFTNTSASSTELEITITANPTDGFGWYDTATPGTLNQLFTTGQIPEVVGVSIPGGHTFGFYLANSIATYRTQSAQNTADTGIQHFTVFRGSGSGNTLGDYYIGVEDQAANTPAGNLTDFDYNDLIIHIQAGNVPEPGSMLLCGAGLAGLGLVFRKRLRKS